MSNLEQTTPDWETVRQVEYLEPTVVPVRQQGPVATWQLPAKRASMQLITVTANNNIEQELIPADPRLKRVWICASATGVTVGTREQIATGNGEHGFQLPASFPMPWEGFEEPIFGVAMSNVIVSLRYEYMAD